MTDIRITGGCQCGAVRYALLAVPDHPHICHCRMCQKAFGSFFAPLVGLKRASFDVTRGSLATFNSSDLAERGFCRDCGTPLTFHFIDSERISVAIGSLDRPQDFPPEEQCGVEGRLPYFAGLASLPGEKSTEDDDPREAAAIAASNHQHPDHDASDWPPSRGAR